MPPIDLGPERVSVWPEGSFITRRRGVMFATDWGSYIFAFNPDEEGIRDRPVVLLPCETLRRMESAAITSERTDASSERMRMVGAFSLSGQVFVYRNRNYILPTAFALADEGVARTDPQVSQKQPTGRDDAPPAVMDGDRPDQPTRTPPDGDAEIDALIADLEAIREAPRAATPIRETPPEAREAGSVELVREGTTISRRRGRLSRTTRGEYVIVFDGDMQTRGDAPMILMPGMVTQDVERTAERFGEITTFEFSGRVFTYRDRNYFQPFMFVAETSRNLKPLQ